MKIRVIGVDGATKEGLITHVGKAVVYLKVGGVEVAVNKHNGTPYGHRSTYSVHPEDVPLITPLEKMPGDKRGKSRKKTNGVPPGWAI